MGHGDEGGGGTCENFHCIIVDFAAVLAAIDYLWFAPVRIDSAFEVR